MIYLSKIHCTLLAISFWFMYIVLLNCCSRIWDHKNKSPTSDHYLGLFVFTVVSLVWDGLSFTSKCPGSPSSLPDPCNRGLLAPPLPHSSASNKQPLINHALLITQALLSALVCEIDLLCALLCQRPHDSVLHIFQGITVGGLFPPPDPLFSSPFHFFFFHHFSPCPILMPPKSHVFSIIRFELLCQKL